MIITIEGNNNNCGDDIITTIESISLHEIDLKNNKNYNSSTPDIIPNSLSISSADLENNNCNKIINSQNNDNNLSKTDDNDKDNDSNKKIKKSKLTKKDIFIIIWLCYGNFGIGTAYSLIAPFFPTEAKLKGASTTEIGLIFGVYELVIFIVSPIFGKIIPPLTPKFMLTSGILLCGSCCVLFGVLQWSPTGTTFVVMCFIVRIIEGIGAAAFFTSCWAIIALEYPDHIGKLFATTEMCFGFGVIIGASLGGVLFELGKKFLSQGFCVPFFVIGSFLLIGTFVMYFLFTEKRVHKVSRTSALKIIKRFSISLNILITINLFILIGFNEATLSLHLKQFIDLPESLIGVIFIICGGFHALFNQVWGYVAEKLPNSHLLCLIGSFLSFICFIIIGPLPFLPFEPNIWLIVASQILLGISFGAQFIGSFVQAIRETVACGFPNNISTTAVISGLFSSAFALGSSIGPAIGGYLVDNWGYRWTTVPLVLCQIIMMMIIIIFNAVQYFKK